MAYYYIQKDVSGFKYYWNNFEKRWEGWKQNATHYTEIEKGEIISQGKFTEINFIRK